MKEPATFERAAAYLAVHLNHAGPLVGGKLPGPFVTISRESGTHGATLAHELVDRLASETGEPWRLYDRLVEDMLAANALPQHLARFLPEDRIRGIDAAIGELVGLHPDLWELVAMMNASIRRLASAGNAVFLGRGANFATSDINNGVHVRVVAAASYRADHVARYASWSIERAFTYNAARDTARRRYVRTTFGRNIDDPAAYTMVFNVERLPWTDMVEMTAQLVQKQRMECS